MNNKQKEKVVKKCKMNKKKMELIIEAQTTIEISCIKIGVRYIGVGTTSFAFGKREVLQYEQ